MFGFEKIEVWERAIEFADIVYSVTGCFPADERFDLTLKMRRASVSISSSIAEGSLRRSAPLAHDRRQRVDRVSTATR